MVLKTAPHNWIPFAAVPSSKEWVMRVADIEDVIAAAAAASELEIDRIETAAAGRRTVLRIFLDGDGPDGRGPSLDQIAQATRAISAALDESPKVGDAPYVLEVSSRGATRPLTDPKHFRRNLGRLVELSLADHSKARGRIKAADADGVRLDVAGAERDVPFADITKAVVQLELTKLPDEDESDVFDDDTDDTEEV